MPSPDGSYLAFPAETIKAEIPLLMGIDTLERESMVADNADNVLDNRQRRWQIRSPANITTCL